MYHDIKHKEITTAKHIHFCNFHILKEIKGATGSKEILKTSLFTKPKISILINSVLIIVACILLLRIVLL